MKVVVTEYKTKSLKSILQKGYEKLEEEKSNILTLLINVGTSIDCFVLTD